MRIATALARHLAGRQRLRERMQATTPLRFLRRLTLIAPEKGIEGSDGVEQSSWPLLDEPVDSGFAEVHEAGEAIAPDERPVNIVENVETVEGVEGGDPLDPREIADTRHIVHVAAQATPAESSKSLRLPADAVESRVGPPAEVVARKAPSPRRPFVAASRSGEQRSTISTVDHANVLRDPSACISETQITRVNPVLPIPAPPGPETTTPIAERDRGENVEPAAATFVARTTADAVADVDAPTLRAEVERHVDAGVEQRQPAATPSAIARDRELASQETESVASDSIPVMARPEMPREEPLADSETNDRPVIAESQRVPVADRLELHEPTPAESEADVPAIQRQATAAAGTRALDAQLLPEQPAEQQSTEQQSTEPQATEPQATEPQGTEQPSTEQSPAAVTAPMRERPVRRARVEEFKVDRARPPVAVSTSSPSRTPLRKQREAEEPRERESDRLFLPTEGVDMSPAAWAARLAGSLQPQQPATTPARSPLTQVGAAQAKVRARTRDAGRQPEAKVQLPDSTRRFLHPLVGIDPETVDIWTGPRSTAVTKAQRADAVAVGGDAIFMASPIDGRSSRDTALVAHELTHVVRQRRPRFVPPVAVESSRGPIADDDEESIARRVEARVNGLAATARIAAVAPADVQEADDSATSVESDNVPAADSDGRPAEWGRLPAPWEPLPTWMSAPYNPVSRTPSPAGNGVVTRVAAPPVSGASQAAGSTAAVVQRAEEGRAVEAPQQSGGSVPAPAFAPHAPDLDVLARQVYTRLKRRIDAESRRELFS
jgi:hypothetical protein